MQETKPEGQSAEVGKTEGGAVPGAKEPAAILRKRSFAGRGGAAVIGLTALLLLLVGGWFARINLLTSPPVAYSSPRAIVNEQKTAPEMSPVKQAVDAPAPQEKRKPVASDTNSKTIRPPSSTEKKEPAAYSYPVIHFHLIGSCKGVLRVSSDALSFVSEKGKDSFTVSYRDCSYDQDGDRLTVSVGSKVYHFKSATAGSKDENRSQLRDIAQSIASFQPPPPNKNP
jgi:hypothetical protein